MIFLEIYGFICQLLSDFSLGLTYLLRNLLVAGNLVSIVFPIYHSGFPVITFGLPILFVATIRQKWIAFLLGIISFISSINMNSVLECIVPNQHCTADSFGYDCIFILFALIYISLIYIVIWMVKESKSDRRN